MSLITAQEGSWEGQDAGIQLLQRSYLNTPCFKTQVENLDLELRQQYRSGPKKEWQLMQCNDECFRERLTEAHLDNCIPQTLHIQDSLTLQINSTLFHRDNGAPGLIYSNKKLKN